MGKIVYIMGKSSTGKDTVFKALLKDSPFNFKTIVSYTTRPIREGEKNGNEYFFTDEKGFNELVASGKVIEERSYDTCHGLWRYFTVADENVDLKSNNYITIGTLESYKKVRDYFGKDKVVPVLIELDDGMRLTRALNREKKQAHPKYEEMCRRFLADAEDFGNEKLKECGIETRFSNENLDECLKNIISYIKKNL